MLGTALNYHQDPIVSSDIIRQHGAIFDCAGMTRVIDNNLVKFISAVRQWWSYTSRNMCV